MDESKKTRAHSGDVESVHNVRRDEVPGTEAIPSSAGQTPARGEGAGKGKGMNLTGPPRLAIAVLTSSPRGLETRIQTSPDASLIAVERPPLQGPNRDQVSGRPPAGVEADRALGDGHG